MCGARLASHPLPPRWPISHPRAIAQGQSWSQPSGFDSRADDQGYCLGDVLKRDLK